MDLAKEEFALWLDFEKRVLDLSLPGHEKPSPKFRLQASALLMLERLGNLLGFHVGHGRFQELVAAHDKNTSALAVARQELFGEVCDSKTLRVLLP